MGILVGGLRRCGPLLGIVLLLSGCGVTKYLEDDEELLASQRISLRKGSKVANRNDVLYELDVLAKQEPNGNFLFLFPREHFYLANNKPKDTTRIDRFLRNTIGQPPVIYSDSLSRRSAGLMTDFLRYRGYFNASSYHEADRRNPGKVNLIYHVDPGPRFFIDSVRYASPDPTIDSLLQVFRQESELQPGAPLDLTAFDREKTRLSQELRNAGYAYFSNNYFDKLEIDTSRREGYADLYLNVLPAQVDQQYETYRVGEITVIADYSPAREANGSGYARDTVVDGIRFLSPNPTFRMRPELLATNIYLQTDSLYSLEAYQKTNLALNGLGIYRFVRINQVIDPIRPNVLNYQIQLTPDKRMAIGVDLDLNYTNRSRLPDTDNSGFAVNNNLIGVSVSPSFRNRNTFGGAELLTVALRAGVEVNPAPDSLSSFLNTIDLGAEATLALPRFKDFGLYRFGNRLGLISDNFYRQLRERASTRYSIAYEYLLLRTFYTYTIANARLGYDFQRSPTTRYRINHAALDILNYTIEPEFGSILANNQRLNLSISDQYFLSLLFRELEYFHSGRPDRRGRSITFNGRFELTGGELFLAEQFVGEIDNDNDFAQYAVVQSDLHYRKQFTPLRSLAARFLFGIGRPFASDREVPFVKQFFAGGANSMRAWVPYALGPGGFVDTLSLTATNQFNQLNLYQTGDLQLEFNLEYRFNLFSYLQGAVFTDVGNVWRVQEDPDRPGSQFRLRGLRRTSEDGSAFYHQPFYKQLAVGGGFGLRLDLSYFVFRLDLSLPLRYNYPQTAETRNGEPLPRNGTPYPEGDYWYDFRRFRLGDITPQLALGYPF
jgi:outer membrane protein assembly factor BamA